MASNRGQFNAVQFNDNGLITAEGCSVANVYVSLDAGGASGQFLKYSAAGTATWSTVTKTDVGLGSVSNYGIALQAEAEAGTSSTKYMTPLRTAQAIRQAALMETYGLNTKNGLYIHRSEVHSYKEW